MRDSILLNRCFISWSISSTIGSSHLPQVRVWARLESIEPVCSPNPNEQMIVAITRLSCFIMRPHNSVPQGFYPLLRTSRMQQHTQIDDEKDTELSSGKHEFGFTRIINIASYSYHARDCKKCGLRQCYGRMYGSNKYPGYERIDDRRILSRLSRQL